MEIKLLDVASRAVELGGRRSAIDRDGTFDDAVESTGEDVEYLTSGSGGGGEVSDRLTGLTEGAHRSTSQHQSCPSTRRSDRE